MAQEKDNILGVIWDAMNKPVPGTGGTRPNPENNEPSLAENIFEKIKDAMNKPVPGTGRPEEELEEVQATKGEYEGEDIDDWAEDDDEDRAEKHAIKEGLKALKDAHHDEWAALKRRHEREREALKREHEEDRRELKTRMGHGWQDRKERRQARSESWERGGPPPWAGGGKSKHKQKEKGSKGRGRGKNKG